MREIPHATCGAAGAGKGGPGDSPTHRAPVPDRTKLARQCSLGFFPLLDSMIQLIALFSRRRNLTLYARPGSGFSESWLLPEGVSSNGRSAPGRTQDYRSSRSNHIRGRI